MSQNFCYPTQKLRKFCWDPTTTKNKGTKFSTMKTTWAINQKRQIFNNKIVSHENFPNYAWTARMAVYFPFYAVNWEIFSVKVFSYAWMGTKIKRTKYSHN